MLRPNLCRPQPMHAVTKQLPRTPNAGFLQVQKLPMNDHHAPFMHTLVYFLEVFPSDSSEICWHFLGDAWSGAELESVPSRQPPTF